jgi:hypothetical protein
MKKEFKTLLTSDKLLLKELQEFNKKYNINIEKFSTQEIKKLLKNIKSEEDINIEVFENLIKKMK